MPLKIIDLLFWPLISSSAFQTRASHPTGSFLSKKFLGAGQTVSGGEIGKKKKHRGKWKHDHYLLFIPKKFHDGGSTELCGHARVCRMGFGCFLTNRQDLSYGSRFPSFLGFVLFEGRGSVVLGVAKAGLEPQRPLQPPEVHSRLHQKSFIRDRDGSVGKGTCHQDLGSVSGTHLAEREN